MNPYQVYPFGCWQRGKQKLLIKIEVLLKAKKMEDLIYNFHKIASNNKLLIELLSEKTILNKQQYGNFCNLVNDTQKLMLDTTICFLNLKNRNKQLEKITVNPFVGDVVKIVRKTLLELRKEAGAKFDKKYIDYINFDNYEIN